MDALSTVDTVWASAPPRSIPPMSTSEMPTLTSSMTLHRASTRYILLRISSAFFFFGLVLPAMKGSFRVGAWSVYTICKPILHHFPPERQSFRNFYIICRKTKTPPKRG